MWKTSKSQFLLFVCVWNIWVWWYYDIAWESSAREIERQTETKKTRKSSSQTAWIESNWDKYGTIHANNKNDAMRIEKQSTVGFTHPHTHTHSHESTLYVIRVIKMYRQQKIETMCMVQSIVWCCHFGTILMLSIHIFGWTKSLQYVDLILSTRK